MPEIGSKLRRLSFRLRLTLFFVLIVVLPMLALAVLVSEIAADSADGKADARLDSGLRTATSLFDEAQGAARPAAKRAAVQIDGDAAALATLHAGDPGRLEDLASQIAREQQLAAVELTDSDGTTVSAGGKPVAAATVRLVDGGGQRIGQVTVATTTSDAFLKRVRDTTGEEAALAGPSGPATGTVSIEAGTVPDPGGSADVELRGDQFRVASTAPLGEEQTRVALFTPAGDEGFFGSRPKVALLFLAFLALAILAVALILRSLQGYVREMLAAARRIGDGDFSSEVPVTGGDEMAGLANEFNKMSGRLSEQMDQLRRQRLEIEASVRRIGEAFASGLDRQALLKILVETAVGTCEADYGLVALSGRVGAEAEAGQAGPAMRAAALAAEGQALAGQGPAEVERGSMYAMSSSIGRIGGGDSPVGSMTIARQGSPFTSAERDVFLYLLGQAQASIENLALHELVSEQAVTDDLTGLANLRAFGEAMEREIARAAAVRPRPLAAAARHRRLQARQRHLRPPPGRRGAARGR